MGADGKPSMEYMRPHNDYEAGDLGLTKWFANRHIAEVHDFTGDALSKNLMDYIASEMKKLRSLGTGIGAPETPKINTIIAIRQGLSKFPETKGTVKHTDNGVLGIASTKATGVTVKHNTEAKVKFKGGVINHLHSSN
ncbi:hypothetical protein [Hylemonella gracilis]|nr:hypothetical protein [Hylemonella gracilis]